MVNNKKWVEILTNKVTPNNKILLPNNVFEVLIALVIVLVGWLHLVVTKVRSPDVVIIVFFFFSLCIVLLFFILFICYYFYTSGLYYTGLYFVCNNIKILIKKRNKFIYFIKAYINLSNSIVNFVIIAQGINIHNR